MTAPFHAQSTRARIAKVVRSLRKERGWTQGDLAVKLDLSQSRLSEIERGGGSFTAEQLLMIVQIFNPPLSLFYGDVSDREGQIQNALARLGASHLQESAAAPPAEDLEQPSQVVCETLIQGDPRQVAALAPLLVANIDRLGLAKVYLDLGKVGLERRLPWLAENVAEALESERADELPRTWRMRERRAAVVLETFLQSVRRAGGGPPAALAIPDLMDPTIRSKQTLDETQAASSTISRRWGVVTALQPADFANALRAARAIDS